MDKYTKIKIKLKFSCILKNRIQLLIRTAGGKAKNKQLGLGHIFRTINLANELQKKFDIHFLIEDFGGVTKILKDHGFSSIKKIPNDVDLKKDIKYTEENIEKTGARILIVDRFRTKKEYLKKMKSEIKTILITDLKNIDYHADLLINGFIGYKNQKFNNKFQTLCIVGPRYQILNSKFQKPKPLRKKFTILASFGGIDEKKISELLLDSIEKILPLIKIKLILGPASQKSEKVKEFEKKYPKNLRVQKGADNMAKEISQSKFGFCTGGLTTYEFAAMKVPFVMICDDTHQLITAKEWHKAKIWINLCLINKKTKRKIQDVVEKMIISEKINYNKINFVDGKGVQRINNEILKLAKMENS